jgi:hypothetical protein
LHRQYITIKIIINTTTPATIPPIKPPVDDDPCTTTVPEVLGYVKITVVDGTYVTGVTYVTGDTTVLYVGGT